MNRSSADYDSEESEQETRWVSLQTSFININEEPVRPRKERGAGADEPLVIGCLVRMAAVLVR